MENQELPFPNQPVTDLSIENRVHKKAQDLSVTYSLNYPSILSRFHAGYFRISLSIASQALLWKVLSDLYFNDLKKLQHVFHKFPSLAFILLWSLALLTQVSLSLVYLLKLCLKFQYAKAEFLHPVGVNYLFAPWISFLLLLQSAPWIAPNTSLYVILWWVFVIPIIALDIKIYGQWFTTERRFLSAAANPTSQMSIVGNLVGARAAARMGWKESAICLFSLGIVHYVVIFVTLYQRLSGCSNFPAMLRPTFFLFVAAPSMASSAWNSIILGEFDTTSKMLFFLSLFIFASLACRPSLFKKSMRKFNVAWWAYSFTITFLALASAEYAKEMKKKSPTPGLMMLVLSALSVSIFLTLLVLTALKIDKLLCGEGSPFSFSSSS